MSLVIVGSVAFDTIQTPFGRREKIVGGSGTYCSLAASFFSPPRIVGVVGEDFPPETLEFFRSKGIDTAGLEKGIMALIPTSARRSKQSSMSSRISGRNCRPLTGPPKLSSWPTSTPTSRTTFSPR
jgi:hypothetical protein